MLDICLKLLAIIGILLLILLGLFLTALLLVLFYPITYRIRGRKDAESLELSVKIKWLAGFLRARYTYPEPGRVKVKLLCFSLYDMKIPPDKGEDKGGEKKDGRERPKARPEGKPAGEIAGKLPEISGDKGEEAPGTESASEEAFGTAENADSRTVSRDGGEDPGKEEEKSGNIFEKIKKIKCTIQGIYDKIKKIWENISYYIALLQEEDTKELFAHALHALGKILKSIRPRRVKADILFGTGSPDTTGYAYGAYCMLTASMKPGFLVTPDFEQKIFQGEFDLAGHVCMGVLLINGLKLLLDKKLHIFIGKIKKKIK